MIQFKQANISTIPEILTLMPQYYAHDHLPFDRAKAEQSVRMLLNDSRFGEIWLLHSTERKDPVGYLVIAHGFSLECAGIEAFVDELFILSEYRGKGLGSQAIQHAIERCKANGVKLLRLEVTKHSNDASKLYKKLGFEDWDRMLLAYPVSNN